MRTYVVVVHGSKLDAAKLSLHMLCESHDPTRLLETVPLDGGEVVLTIAASDDSMVDAGTLNALVAEGSIVWWKEVA